MFLTNASAALSTIGLGDYAPTTNESRFLCATFACLGLGALASLFSALSAVGAERAAAVKAKAAAALPRHKQAPNGSTAPANAVTATAAAAAANSAAGAKGNEPRRASAPGAGWTVVAKVAMAELKSRRGDTMRSLLPRVGLALAAMFLLMLIGSPAFRAFERDPEEFRALEFDAFADVAECFQEDAAVSDAQASGISDLLEQSNPNALARAVFVRNTVEAALAGGVVGEADGGAEGVAVLKWDFAGCVGASCAWCCSLSHRTCCRVCVTHLQVDVFRLDGSDKCVHCPAPARALPAL